VQELLNTQIESLKLRVPIIWDVKTGRNWAMR
jgi:DNA polymerase I-like protein with 3'-5' exonuclease and polymerase domains